jgi:formate dehydrogenase subunit gamma
MKKAFYSALLLVCVATGALAQNKAADAAPAAPVSGVVASDTGAIKSQNIMEVRPDANLEPGYATQTNAERNKVQPGNNTPFWRQVGAGVTGTSTLPFSQAPEAGNLIQPFVQYPGSSLTNAGEAWRQVRNNWIIPYGGALLLLVVVALGLFFKAKGTIPLQGAETGKKIERFTYFERAAHWSNAIAFVILAVSGIIMAFGKFFLHPVIGATLFGWLTYALKNAHNFAGPVFAVSLLVVLGTFVKDNLPSKEDWDWVLKGGGLFSGHEPTSHRFNAGEKIVFWGGVFFLGLIVVGTGLVLDKLVPGLIYERSTMQIAHMIHGVATVLMMALFAGHIYMGTVGMKGAYEGMKTGYVDETWAKEHHGLWYDDIKAGKIPAQRTVPASSTSAQPVQA